MRIIKRIAKRFKTNRAILLDEVDRLIKVTNEYADSDRRTAAYDAWFCGALLTMGMVLSKTGYNTPGIASVILQVTNRLRLHHPGSISPEYPGGPSLE